MGKKPFSIISKGKPTIPVIAHVPHSSTFIPQNVRNSIALNDADLEKELILMTDRFVPELFAGIVAAEGLAFVNNYSRLVVDPERFEKDEDEVIEYINGIDIRKLAARSFVKNPPSTRPEKKNQPVEKFANANSSGHKSQKPIFP